MRAFAIACFCLVALVGFAAAAQKPEMLQNHFKKMEDHCVAKKVTSQEECLKSLTSWYKVSFKGKKQPDGGLSRFKETLENFVKLGDFSLTTSCNRNYMKLLKATENVIGWDLDDANRNAVTKFPMVFALWSKFNHRFHAECPSISD